MKNLSQISVILMKNLSHFGHLRLAGMLCVAVTRHDFWVTPSRLIEGTATRPSYDSPTNCATDPRLAHDRHWIIILIHDRRTTPSRRFQDSRVTLLGYIKTRLRLVGGRPASSSPSFSTDPNSPSSPSTPFRPSSARMMDLGIPSSRAHSEGDRQAYICL